MIGRLKSHAGYTLTEVLVVLAIVGLLAGLAIPMMTTSVQKAREAALRTNLATLRETIDAYYGDNLGYPETLQALVNDGYLRALPADTINRGTDDWAVERGENGGIIDIRSRSTQKAMDGTTYANW